MLGDYWYYRSFAVNRLYDLKRQRKVYGLRSFLPHRHVPHRRPAGDGFYCKRCGTRKAIVQLRATGERSWRR
ncbi:MAG TPA: hypothetical protein VKU80_17545 [Planctomycetota bacterium]|nr:hypothetical protein [Planctomycetota bacterium]